MAQPALAENREFDFNERDFAFLSRFVKERAGIVLADHKRNMVYSRLARRLRELKLKRFGDYCSYIESPRGEEEISHLINAITTNLTSFFREKHHFDYLAEQLKTNPHLFPGKKIRIWSAGCSAGMEVYSMAITLAETLDNIASYDIKLLATDIDTNILDRAAAGNYRQDDIEGLPSGQVKKYFNMRPDGGVQIAQSLRSMVHFKRLNLMDERWPMRGPFPVMFCRNVMIYFDKPTQKTLVHKFAKLVPKGGFLMIGHSENIFNVTQEFKLKGKTIYERC